MGWYRLEMVNVSQHPSTRPINQLNVSQRTNTSMQKVDISPEQDGTVTGAGYAKRIRLANALSALDGSVTHYPVTLKHVLYPIRYMGH